MVLGSLLLLLPVSDPVAEAHQQALALYAKALLFERDSNLLQAVKALEEARKLDPNAAPIHKALTQLYLALDRSDDALAAGAKALELDPSDFESAYLHARHLRNLKRLPEGAAVLAKALDRLGPKEEPELRGQLALDLAAAHDELDDPAKCAAALRQAIVSLEQRDAILALGKVTARELDELTAEAHERLALACVKQKQADGAQAAFQRAARLDPARAPRLALHLALLHETQGRAAEALRASNDYLKAVPGDVAGYEVKCRLLRTLGRGAESVALLEAVLEERPSNVPLRVLLGKEYVRSGRGGAAEALYRKALETQPTPELAAGLIERIRAGANAGQQLLDLLDKHLSAAAGREPDDDEPEDKGVPGDPAAAAQARAILTACKRDAETTTLLLQAMAARLTANGKTHYSTRSALGTLAARCNQLALAETLYRSCLRGGGAPRQAEHAIYGGLLNVLAQGRKHKEIVALCQESLPRARATNSALFHDYTARSLMALGRAAEALAAADEAIKAGGERSEFRLRLGRAQLLAEADKVPAAVAECQALFKDYTKPDEIREIRHTLAIVYSLARNLAQAEEQLKLMIEADPTDATAHNDLGYHYAEENRNLEEAERLVRRALALDRQERGSGTAATVDNAQDNPAYVDSLGWVLFRRGKFVEARRELERATHLAGGSDDPTIWDHLGDVLVRLDERVLARTAYQKALKLYENGHRRREPAISEIQKKLRLVQP